MAFAISLCIIPSKLLPICEEFFSSVLFHSLFPPMYLLLLLDGLSVAKLLVLLLLLLFCRDLGSNDRLADSDLFFFAVLALFIPSGRGGRGGGGIFCMPSISAHFVLFWPGGRTIAPGGKSKKKRIEKGIGIEIKMKIFA